MVGNRPLIIRISSELQSRASGVRNDPTLCTDSRFSQRHKVEGGNPAHADQHAASAVITKRGQADGTRAHPNSASDYLRGQSPFSVAF